MKHFICFAEVRRCFIFFWRNHDVVDFFLKKCWGTQALWLGKPGVIISSEKNLVPHYFFSKKGLCFSGEMMRHTALFSSACLV
jgi:hypothetical protein